ncbi:MAG TPA: DUF819 family protein [Vicinamibacterales bacterium]|nr:DUF819 family protein [Vicinamibacterales bacterium]
MNELRTDPLFITAILLLLIAVSEWLSRRGGFRHFGSALLVIMLGAVAANLGVIPAGSTAEAPVAVYDAIFTYVAPIAIFWLLLCVNVRDVLKAGLPLVALFLAGSAATVAGTVLGMRVVGGEASIGPLYQAIAGMFAGTYTGGSVNFNAVALHYGVVRDGVLYSGSIVVDNIVTTVWFVATLAVPRAALLLRSRGSRSVRMPAAAIVDLDAERETLDPRGSSLVLALGIGALWFSELTARLLAARGLNVPSILLITGLALALAQFRSVSRLPGARVLGMCGVYLFLTVIGAFCDVQALGRLGTLGIALLVFASITVLTHGAILFGVAWLFGMDIDGAAVASQANVGGGATALALAKSLGREDLLLPGVLLGSLGYAIGTFLGFLAASLT